MAQTDGYNQLLEIIATAAVDLESDTIKIALMDDTFTFDPDNTGFSDVSGSELSGGNGYTAGGLTISNAAIDRTGANIIFTFDPAEWTATGGDIGPVYFAVIYDDTHAGDALLAYIYFDGAYTALEDAKLIITPNPTGGLFGINKVI